MNNVIIGNASANVINGEAGNDTLTGGGGADTFVFTPGSGHDVVTDWQSGDTLDFSAYLSKGISPTLSVVSGGVEVRFDANDFVVLQGADLATFSQTSSGFAYQVAGPTSFTYQVTGQAYTTSTFEYDAADHLVGKVLSGYTGQAYASLAYSYDATGRQTGLTELDAKGAVIQSTTVAYQSDGSYTRTTLEPASATFSTDIASYSASGQEITDTQIGWKKVMYTTLTSTYSSGALSTQLYSGYVGTDYVQQMKTYDSQGHVSTIQYFEADGSMKETAYDSGQVLADNHSNLTINAVGNDETFVILPGQGRETISGYSGGNDSFDISQSEFTDFSVLMSHAKASGQANTLVTLDAHDSILIVGLTPTLLAQHASDFHFH